MKAYVMSTCAAFGLIVVAHIWRAIAEGSALAKDPFFVLMTIAAATFCLWALRVLKTMPRS